MSVLFPVISNFFPVVSFFPSSIIFSPKNVSVPLLLCLYYSVFTTLYVITLHYIYILAQECQRAFGPLLLEKKFLTGKKIFPQECQRAFGPYKKECDAYVFCAHLRIIQMYYVRMFVSYMMCI